jgi:AcrR family transcriptional regulator
VSALDLPQRPGGRAARVRAAVIDATITLMFENEGTHPTVNEIAGRSGVHETSIYRRWGTREKLIIDALLSHSADEFPIPDTGTLQGDLAALGTTLIHYLATPIGQAQVQAFASAGADPAIEATRREFWESRMQDMGIVVVRAIERGEVRPDTDPALVTEIGAAIIHFRSLLTHAPLNDCLPTVVARILVEGLKP